MRIQPITITKGDTWPNTLSPITNRDTGAVENLTGATIWLTIKEEFDDADDDAAAVVQLGVGTGLTVADPASGIVAVEIPDEDTDLLDPGTTYRYDVQVRKGGKTFTPIGGRLTVTRDTTRA